MATTVIINDDNIIQNLKALLENPEQFADAHIKIGHIAPLEIKLKGAQFHHSLTSTVMKGLLDFQEGLYRSYCIAKYNSSDLRYLDENERNKLELVIVVNAGCTEILATIQSAIDSIKEFCVDMTPTQKIVALSLILLAITGYFAINGAKEYLIEKDSNITKIALEKETTKQILSSQDNIIEAYKAGEASQHQDDELQNDEQTDEDSSIDQSSTDDSDVTADSLAMINSQKNDSYFKVLTPINQEDLAILESVRATYPQASNAFDAMNYGVERLIKSTAQADTVRFNNVAEMSGSMAKKITVKEREISDKVIMTGEFRVLEFDSSRTDVRKTKLRDSDGIEFLAKFTDGSIGKEKINKLNQAFWGYHPIELSVEAKNLKGKIVDALITQVRNVNKDHSFKDNSEEV
tara:strand:- start:6119 stop:7336 length:1218 start_codon:yes stop_codon:yes gene_type:complete